MGSAFCFIRARAKAIAAAVAGGIAAYAARKGFVLSIEQETALVLAVAGIVTYIVPNRDCDSAEYQARRAARRR